MYRQTAETETTDEQLKPCIHTHTHLVHNILLSMTDTAVTYDHLTLVSRVHTDIQMLFSRTYQDLQRPNSWVFQDSKIIFSRTFQETFHSKHWLHEVKKVHIQNRLSVYLH